MRLKKRYISRFGKGVADPALARELLGNKGAGLVEMTRLGMPVPPGFTITTDVCQYYMQHGELPAGFEAELQAAMLWLEASVEKKFGGAQNPLLVSVRSGATVSMPGMMDTILNVGLTRGNIAGFAEQSGSMRFALDSYRRLLQMMGAVVFEVPKATFDDLLLAAREREAVATEAALSEAALGGIAESFHAAIAEHAGISFPEVGYDQLRRAIHAVFASWDNPRATYYRKLQGISDELGTAVTVQAMIFGNAGTDSGTGVGFTRNPSTGEREIFGEFMTNAQGEDIVSGARTPMSIASLELEMPQVYNELVNTVKRLELHYRDVQDFEFTIEHGQLYLLQTRSAKRSALAAVRIAVEMASEGLISKDEAVARIKPEMIGEILTAQLDLTTGDPEAIATGIAASPGAAVGRIALSAEQAVRAASSGTDPVILVSQETTAEDIHGMVAAAGLLTSHGGATSHAAVVARGMGKCCITGAREVCVDAGKGVVRIGNHTYPEGEWISLDASTGRIFAGRLAMRPVETNNPYLDTLLQWTSGPDQLEVRANADTPEDARTARAAGARGIGLCRTEHMFFSPERVPLVRAMILASAEEERTLALEKLLPMQQQDFEEIFRQMSPLPVTIRLLDPPLHEFLPSLHELAVQMDAAKHDGRQNAIDQLARVTKRVLELTETNPMMGHRGCRLSITYPEILAMQVRAILLAALAITREGLHVHPEIMVPLVSSAEEIRWLRARIDATAAEVFASQGASIPYSVGTMIELPRAAVCACAIAEHVSFVSFGTNDLTQMTFGFSRDDTSSFLPSYLEQGILHTDPFVTIDRQGVGALIQMAVSQLRREHPKVKIGICGEHGGDPKSIEFFAALGVDYVSCSPARVSVARLAVAHAASAVLAELPS